MKSASNATGPSKKKVFDGSCPIAPYVVADAVVMEAADLFRHLGDDAFSDEKTRALADALAEEAERICQANDDFRRKIIHTNGTLGRDRLYAFMRHWLASMLLKQHGERIRNTLENRRVFESFARGQDPSGRMRATVF